MRNALLAVLIVTLLTSFTAGQTAIEIATPMPPPPWAYMERALLAENARLMKVFAERYVNPNDGSFECVEHWGGADGPDDIMENFYNWPMVYILGGERETLDLLRFIWEGHLRQYTRVGMYHREFITSFDWEHNGEGLAPFLLLPLADPDDLRNRQRLIRFADFYTGRDRSAGNYDPEHKIIKSILNGSRGPKLEATGKDWGDREDVQRYADWTNVRGDVPMNLIVTSLVANAYILTGEDHYRDWVIEYVDAWRKRAAANNGWMPSIVGLNGQVGEGWNGKWYGGIMGWDWTFGGWVILGRAVRIGFANATLLGGPEYVDTLRAQGQRLLENRMQSEAGLLFRDKYGANGPYGELKSYAPMFEGLYSDIYLSSLDARDRVKLYEACRPGPRERRRQPIWKYEYEAGRFEGGNEIGWIDFLEGNDPDYPVRALQDAFARIRWGRKGIREDKTTPDTRRADSPHGIRPGADAPLGVIGAATEALVNLTMGGTQPLWGGGLLRSELRYFDPERRRPGLPEDVAALVTGITSEAVRLTLVNLNQGETRRVIVQTGAYGEHTCERVVSGSKSIAVGSNWFEVQLEPGAGGELTLDRKKFTREPTARLPWQ